MANNPCVILRNAADRGRACRWVQQAADGVVVEFKQKNRSGDQNSALWSILSQVLKQRPTHNGVKMSGVLWKAIFMQATGAELVMLPTLDGDGWFPFGHRSSKLTVGEMSDLIEFMLSWCAREGLTTQHFDGLEQAA